MEGWLLDDANRVSRGIPYVAGKEMRSVSTKTETGRVVIGSCLSFLHTRQ